MQSKKLRLDFFFLIVLDLSCLKLAAGKILQDIKCPLWHVLD